MVEKSKKNILMIREPTANQKVSEALQEATQSLNAYETTGNEELRKMVSRIVQKRKLSSAELESQLIDALCQVEVADKKIEIYEEAISKIKVANKAAKEEKKGGRPKNPWAEFAYEHSKLHLIEKGRLPTAKQLSKNVCNYALNNGFKESASGKEAFSVSTAKDYLGFFKNTSGFLEFLTAKQWFSIFEGNFVTTKFLGENKFPP
jgi:acetyl/propionyl-CoA carboxylase alpha subunit